MLFRSRNRMTKQKEIAARSSQAAEAATQTTSAGRPFTPPSWGKGEPAIFIALTGGWRKTVTKGPNFDLHQVVSTSSTASLIIYVGPYAPEIGKTAATTTMVAVGTNAVAFAVTERDSHYYAEGIVKDAFRGYADAGETSPGIGELKLHIMIFAQTHRELMDLFRSLQTLRPVLQVRTGPQEPDNTR